MCYAEKKIHQNHILYILFFLFRIRQVVNKEAVIVNIFKHQITVKEITVRINDKCDEVKFLSFWRFFTQVFYSAILWKIRLDLFIIRLLAYKMIQWKWCLIKNPKNPSNATKTRFKQWPNLINFKAKAGILVSGEQCLTPQSVIAPVHNGPWWPTTIGLIGG